MAESREDMAGHRSGVWQHIVPAFHGTSASNGEAIVQSGFDFEHASGESMYGQGLYFWENDPNLCKPFAKMHSSGCVVVASINLTRSKYRFLDLTRDEQRALYKKVVNRMVRRPGPLRDEFLKADEEGVVDDFCLELVRETLQKNGTTLNGVRMLTRTRGPRPSGQQNPQAHGERDESAQYAERIPGSVQEDDIDYAKLNVHAKGETSASRTGIVATLGVMLVVWKVDCIGDAEVLYETHNEVS